MSESWDEALKRVLAANKAQQKHPSSMRQLSFALGANNESWRRTLNRVRAANRATEQTAVTISEALGVPRAELPPAAPRPSTFDLADRLEEVEAGLNSWTQTATGLVKQLRQVRKENRALTQRVDALEKQGSSRTEREA